METRKLRTDGTTETALTAIAQMGMVTRRALATMLFYLTQGGEMERYTSNTVALSRAVERLKSIGYVSEVPYDGKKYLAATTLGKDYCHKYELPTSELLTGLSVDNAGHRKAIVANSDAITVARSMRVLALPAEKPEFAEFATLLGALTVFNNSKKGYTKEELLEDLNTGICYSKLEMREAYNNSSISGMRNNSSQRVGIIFKPAEVTVLYQMEKKDRCGVYSWRGGIRPYHQKRLGTVLSAERGISYKGIYLGAHDELPPDILPRQCGWN